MAHLAPVGPVYQAGTLSGNPIATTAGLTTLRLADRRGLHPARRGRGDDQRAGRRGARPPRVCPTSCRRPETFSVSSSSIRRRSRSSATSTTPAGRRCTGSGRSSTPCSTRASTCRPSAFEAWFVSAAHDDRAIDRIATALPRRRSGRCRRSRDEPSRTDARPERSPSTTTVVHLLRHGEVDNPRGHPLRPAARLPPQRARRCRWPSGSPKTLAGPRHHPPGVLAAGAGPGDRRSRRRRRSASTSSPTSG